MEENETSTNAGTLDEKEDDSFEYDNDDVYEMRDNEYPEDYDANVLPDEAEINITEDVYPDGSRSTVNSEKSSNNWQNKHQNPKLPTQPRNNRNKLTAKEKKKIGKWGEKYALRCIKEELNEKYTECIIKETQSGFEVYKKDKKLVKVIWLNKEKDTGVGYDIKIVEENKTTYIEVKSTKSSDKDLFELSNKQLQIATKEKDNYFIYRVFNAKKEGASLKKFCNPIKLIKERKISIKDISIRI